jgi:hypothetical protein
MGDAPGFSAGAQFESSKEQRQEDPVTDNTVDAATPDTIVLIHGFWMTPRSWERWVKHYESRGYNVLAPHTQVSKSRSRHCAKTPPRSRL